MSDSGADVLTLMRAAVFSAQAHVDQRRKGAGQEPYVNHVLEVANMLAIATGGTDTTLLVGALLHDTVEDCGVLPADLEGRFGREVASLVAEVTDDKSLPKAERKRLQVVNAPHKSDRAKRLKIADKISNLQALVNSPPADWSEERKRDYFTWAHQVVDGLRGVDRGLEAAFDAAYEAGMSKLTTGGLP